MPRASSRADFDARATALVGRVLEILAAGLFLGGGAACVDRAVEPIVDPHPACSAWCDHEVECGLRDTSAQSCVDGCVQAPAWEAACAVEFEEWFFCLADLSCDELTWREEFPADRPRDEKPCGPEELQWQSCIHEDDG